jgi:thiamine transport system ATP-binding protein
MHRWSKPDIAVRVAEVLDLVGLAGFDRRPIGGLSGGERQRVALARALAPRPSFLLLDEPLGSLDRALRDRLLDDMSEVLRVSGATVVHVTHDQSEAFATGDRIVVMRDGRIAQVGAPDDVWHRPVDAGVARIVGPVTLVPVQVEAGGVVRAPWGEVRVDATAVAGGAGLLMLRPDDLAVTDVDGPTGDRRVAGIVSSRSFHGDHVTARVRVGTAEDPVVEITVADRSGAVPSVGESIVLELLRASVVTGEAGATDR